MLWLTALSRSPRTPLRLMLTAAAVISLISSGQPPSNAMAQAAPPRSIAVPMPQSDRIRIAESFRLSDAVGESTWRGWNSAPFALLLVTDSTEYLVRHPSPSNDFTKLGYDSLLRSDVFVRPRVFSPTLLATFPAVGGISTIVVGQARATDRSSTRWVLTVLHEHFHQLQYSRPGYAAGVRALDLSGGDSTGMWMLNYPFPYASRPVRSRFGALTRQLDRALISASSATAGNTPATGGVGDAVSALRAALPDAAWRYLAFQSWQEGVALYTEMRVARLAAASSYSASAAFRALPDYADYRTALADLEAELHVALKKGDLAGLQRVAFYLTGAATASLLDHDQPNWRDRYFDGPFLLATPQH